MIALKDKDLFRQQALIGGNWRDASTKATVDVIDPASQNVLGTIPGLVFVHLGSRDVVRHRIVQDIVDAYERREKTK